MLVRSSLPRRHSNNPFPRRSSVLFHVVRKEIPCHDSHQSTCQLYEVNYGVVEISFNGSMNEHAMGIWEGGT